MNPSRYLFFSLLWQLAGVLTIAASLSDHVAAEEEADAPAQSSAVAPYPPSPVIERVSFDFSTECVFGAGSDQWPMTWSGDGHLYAAWGDGWGWTRTGQGRAGKHSIGVTRISGVPPELSGEDLWGDGPGSGFGKPEALVALGDTLNMFWTRGDSKYDDDTATAVSHDGGVTWTYGDGKAFPTAPPGFRVRGICQFGPGYAGALDEYVYMYFGFNRLNDLFLGRVPREHLFDAERYEWFTRLTDSGDADWSDDFSARKPVFHDPNGYVWHIGVSHNRGMGRFLLTKPHYAGGDDRDVVKVGSSGIASFGLFDAPRPWGPWTTVAYQDTFKDEHVKFSYFIPTKFLSDDGTKFWLAWSGWPEYDSVSFVQGTMTLHDQRTKR